MKHVADKNTSEEVVVGDIVYLRYIQDITTFECFGKVVDNTPDNLVIGFNFYLGEAVDTAQIQKTSIVHTEFFRQWKD